MIYVLYCIVMWTQLNSNVLTVSNFPKAVSSNLIFSASNYLHQESLYDICCPFAPSL